MLGKLRGRRANLQRVQLSILSPIRRLPAEIIVAIFENSCTEDLDISVWPRDNVHLRGGGVALWTYTRICRFWRAAIFSLRERWSTIYANISHQGCSHDVEALNFIIAQSNTHPLDLVIHRRAPLDLLTHKYFEYSEYALQMLEILVSHSDFWGEVSLCLDSAFYQRIRKIKHRLSQLKTLRITNGSRIDITIPSSTIEALFEDAPQLATVLIDDVENLSDMGLPWKRIIDFTMGCRQGNYNNYDVLSKMYNIIKYECCDFWSSLSPQGPTIASGITYQYPHLQELFWGVPAPIPEWLIAPNLARLRIEHPDYKTRVPQIMSLIHRSSCQLSLIEIDLGNYLVDGAAFHMLELFEALPNLTCLKIKSLERIVLLRLSLSTNSSSFLLPKLRSLTIGVSSKAEIEALDAMVRSRAAGFSDQQEQTTKLESCKVEAPHDLRQNMMSHR